MPSTYLTVLLRTMLQTLCLVVILVSQPARELSLTACPGDFTMLAVTRCSAENITPVAVTWTDAPHLLGPAHPMGKVLGLQARPTSSVLGDTRPGPADSEAVGYRVFLRSMSGMSSR